MPMIQEVEVLQDFICPISHEIMLDPVVDSQGRAYERESITRWINEHGTHPTDRTAMKVDELQNAPGLTRQIRSFVLEHPALLDNHEVYVPSNMGQLMIDAVKSNIPGVVGYLVRVSEGHAQRQGWLDGAFVEAANASKLDLMRLLHAAGAALPENAGQLMIDAVRADNADIVEFYIAASEGHEQRQSWLDGAFAEAAKLAKLDLMRQLHVVGAILVDPGSMLIASIANRNEEVEKFLVKNIQFSADTLGGALLEAVSHRSHNSIVRLHEAGANLHIVCPKGFSSLDTAVRHGYHEIAQLLIELGASELSVQSTKYSQRIKTVLELTDNERTRHNLAYAFAKRTQRLTELQPKVNQLQQKVEALEATVAQQSAQIAQLLEALQQQQQATAAGGAEKPDSNANASARLSARSHSPEPGQEATASANQETSRSRSLSH